MYSLGTSFKIFSFFKLSSFLVEVPPLRLVELSVDGRGFCSLFYFYKGYSHFYVFYNFNC